MSYTITLDWDCTNNTYRKKAGPKMMTKKGFGTCMSMSTHWAKMCLKHGRKLESRTEMPNDIAMSAMHVRKTWDFNKAKAKGKSPDWHGSFFEPLQLKGTLVGSGSNVSTMKVNTGAGAYVFSIYGSNGGHSMAFWRSGGKHAFYDPNLGQCSTTKSSALEKDIRKWVVDAYPNLQNAWYVYKVVRD